MRRNKYPDKLLNKKLTETEWQKSFQLHRELLDQHTEAEGKGLEIENWVLGAGDQNWNISYFSITWIDHSTQLHNISTSELMQVSCSKFHPEDGQKTVMRQLRQTDRCEDVVQ